MAKRAAAARRGPGRPPGRRPKGDRSAITVRVPTTDRDVYEEAAEKAGLPLGDYIAVRLAESHGLDEPAYVRRDREQVELPIPLGA